MPGDHKFTAVDGTVYSFETQQEMIDFGTQYAIGNLVAKGYGEIITNEAGEECFKINEKGLAHYHSMIGIVIQ